jgi:hypothetical protein
VPTWKRSSFETELNEKADVAEHPQVFHHVGVLVNGPPGTAGLPFN